MTRTKEVTLKKPKSAVEESEDVELSDADAADSIPQKITLPLDVEEPVVEGFIDDKTEVDPAFSSDSEDELASDDADLDTEEIDPFGDKWEE